MIPPLRGGTNLGPTSDKLINGQHKKDAAGNAVNDPSNFDGIKDLVAAYRTANGLKETDAVPADAVTRSGSGLDPHISVANAASSFRAWRGNASWTSRPCANSWTSTRRAATWDFRRAARQHLLLNLALDGKLPVNG